MNCIWNSCEATNIATSATLAPLRRTQYVKNTIASAGKGACQKYQQSQGSGGSRSPSQHVSSFSGFDIFFARLKVSTVTWIRRVRVAIPARVFVFGF